MSVDRDVGITWYLNGAASSTNTSSDVTDRASDDLSNGGSVTIGQDLNTNFDDHAFDGQIDDLYVYIGKALSADEAKRNHNAGKRSHR